MNFLLILPLFLIQIITPIHSKNPIVILYCDFKFTHEEHQIITDQLYECEVNQNPAIVSPIINISAMFGDHKSTELEENDVTSLKISNKSFQFFYFPIGFTLVFKNLQVLRVNDVGLRKVHKRDLELFKELTVLDLHGNYIEYLDGKLFSENKKLQLICLTPNNILYIDSKTFQGLRQLKTLNILENPCVENATSLDTVDKKVQQIQNGKCSDFMNFLNQNYPSIGERFKSLESQLEKMKREMSTLNFVIEEKEEETTELKLEKIQLQGKIIEMEKEKSDEEKLKEKLSKKLSNLEETNKNLEKEMLDLFKLKQKEKLDKEDALEKLQVLRSQLLAQKDEKIKDEQNLHNKTQSELSEKLNKAVNQLSETRAALEDQKTFSKDCIASNKILTKNSAYSDQKNRELSDENLKLREEIDVKNVEKLEMEKASVLERLTDPKVVDKTIWYIAIPLNCLLTLITIAVIFAYRRRDQGKIYKIEELPFVGEEMSNVEGGDGKMMMKGYD